jgi:hypothetical protein
MHQAGMKQQGIVTLIITGETVSVVGTGGKMATHTRFDVIRGVGEEKGIIV